MIAVVLIALLSPALLSRCKNSYITSLFRRVLALLRPVDHSRQLRRQNCQAPTSTLPIHVAAAHPSNSSTTYPRGGILHCPQRPLFPRNKVFHFRTTSCIPQALPIMQFNYDYYHQPTSGVGGVAFPSLHFNLSFLVFLGHSHL